MGPEGGSGGEEGTWEAPWSEYGGRATQAARPSSLPRPCVLSCCSQLTLASLAALVLTLALFPGFITPPLYSHTARS